MKKVLVLLMAIGVVVACCGSAEAGIANTKHDMYTSGKGTDPNVCGYCHMPHNAAGDKIWSTWANEAQLTSGPSSTVGNMCYTCHDGTITNKGQNSVFNDALQQHKTDAGSDCNICHTVHDNTNGKFLGVVKTNGTYCETCHGANQHVNATYLGDHTAGSEHPNRSAGGEDCTGCHKMHGAAAYVDPNSSITHPILYMDNTDSAMCVDCHGNAKVQATTGGNKHPVNLATAGTWGKMDCEKCHDVHQPNNSGRTAILAEDNTDSAYCMTCHQPVATTNGPKIGDHTHPAGVAFTSVGTTPSGSDIDDDNANGVDYAGNSANLVCESCHSVHRKGVASPLLRVTDAGGALCANCHANK